MSRPIDADKLWMEIVHRIIHNIDYCNDILEIIEAQPTVKPERKTEPEIVRCKDCKHWRQQTNYQGTPLSFGFCESDDMWHSLYGETTEVSHIDTDDDFYCGYAERKDDD